MLAASLRMLLMLALLSPSVVVAQKPDPPTNLRVVMIEPVPPAITGSVFSLSNVWTGAFLSMVAAAATQFWRLVRRRYSSTVPINSVSTLLSHLPEVWSVFGVFLPAKARLQCFEPCHGDLVSAYLARCHLVGRIGQLWVALSFTFRLLLIVADCYRVHLISLLSDPIRDWWRRQ